MKVVALSSGSKGNCYYVETSKNKILLDAGRNYKYIKEKLAEINVNINDINYILITHTHSDHITALKTIVSKTQATVVVTQKIFYELNDIKDYEHIFIYEDNIDLDGVIINSIHSSHDAIDSRNFIKLSNLDMYLFESNHDIELLQHGPYPAWLKKRVISDEGHLSNKAASFYLSKLVGPNTKKIILIHLSETNNNEEIALETIRNTFIDYDIDFDNISCAKQNEISEVINL